MSLKNYFQPDDFEFSDLNDLFGSENHSSANRISLDAYKNQNEEDDLDIDENLFSKKDHDSEFQINFQPKQPVQNRNRKELKHFCEHCKYKDTTSVQVIYGSLGTINNRSYQDFTIDIPNNNYKKKD